MSARTVEASVDVAVQPAMAFKVFTEELDRWWLQGPINFYDSTRAFGARMEPGLGGRILEVYDPDSGEGLEVARITAWEPPDRLAWSSSLDDVQTEVRFAQTSAGTTVTVTATVPDGGQDRGGTSWTRVVPTWLPRWLARRDAVGPGPHPLARLAVVVRYADPGAAARWLRDVLCLEAASAVPAPGAVLDPGHTWIELRSGDASVVVLHADGDERAGGPPAVTPWVFVDDLDAHHAHATTHGAEVVEPIWHHGARAYAVRDQEGVVWTVAQATPAMRGAPIGP